MENYRQIKADLDALRLLVEKSELWVYKNKLVMDKKRKDTNNNNQDEKVIHEEIFINIWLTHSVYNCDSVGRGGCLLKIAF